MRQSRESIELTDIQQRNPVAINDPAECGYIRGKENSDACQIHEEDVSDTVQPAPHEASWVVESLKKPLNKWRLVSACSLSFVNGIQDSALGALIPCIEQTYSIGYAIVSLLFLTTAFGFIFAAFTSQPIYASVGRSGVLTLATATAGVGFLLWAVAPGRTPYGFLIIAPLFTGAGTAWNLAQINVFVSSLDKPTLYSGYLHGFYGLGGVSGPLAATAMISHGIAWHNFWYLPLGITTVNLVSSSYIFRLTEAEKEQAAEQQAAAQESSSSDISRGGILKATLRSRPTILAALFILAYQGAEVSLAGWIVSFLINYRGGNPSQVGYVASGFWGGVTAGRFMLSWACGKVGERKAVVALLVGSLGLEILVWLIPNVIGSALSISFVGFFLGPIYPCNLAVITRLLPRNLHVSSLAFMSAFGSSGGALSPFTVGILAQFKGPYVVHPVAIASFVVMEVLWLLLPRVPKRVL